MISVDHDHVSRKYIRYTYMYIINNDIKVIDQNNVAPPRVYLLKFDTYASDP